MSAAACPPADPDACRSHAAAVGALQKRIEALETQAGADQAAIEGLRLAVDLLKRRAPRILPAGETRRRAERAVAEEFELRG